MRIGPIISTISAAGQVALSNYLEAVINFKPDRLPPRSGVVSLAPIPFK
jgi:hypothetical protein